MIAANSRLDAPSASSDRSKRSRETVGSPASIFATRDWLDLIDLAISTCVTPRACRRAFSPSASRSRSSTYAASSSESPRNSLAVPTFQPLLSSLFRWLSRIVILLETSTGSVDHLSWCRFSFLWENLEDHNRISVNSVDNSPVVARVSNTQFVAVLPDNRHRPGLRHPKGIPTLQLAQQEPCLNPCHLRKWRSFNFTMKPNNRFVFWAHLKEYMSILTYTQIAT
jgi:hypothetical protein